MRHTSFWLFDFTVSADKRLSLKLLSKQYIILSYGYMQSDSYARTNQEGIPMTSQLSIEKLKLVIRKYKKNFDTVNKQERYKYVAISWYKQHWNIEAEDFAEMLTVAFSKAYNLLSNGMYYPYKMLTDYAKADPETVRGLFRMLHDESRSLADRYNEFRTSFKEWLTRVMNESPGKYKSLQHYQDLRAIMVYLTFEYPEKYYLFKSTMFSTFAKRVGYTEEKPKIKSVVWKAESFARMCEIVLQALKADGELIALTRETLDDSCYQDEALHLLAMNVIYYGAVYLSEDDFIENPPVVKNTEYWPSIEEYDPGITKEMWIAALNDRSVTTYEALDMLQKMLELVVKAPARIWQMFMVLCTVTITERALALANE